MATVFRNFAKWPSVGWNLLLAESPSPNYGIPIDNFHKSMIPIDNLSPLTWYWPIIPIDNFHQRANINWNRASRGKGCPPSPLFLHDHKKNGIARFLPGRTKDGSTLIRQISLLFRLDPRKGQKIPEILLKYAVARCFFGSPRATGATPIFF